MERAEAITALDAPAKIAELLGVSIRGYVEQDDSKSGVRLAGHPSMRHEGEAMDDRAFQVDPVGLEDITSWVAGAMDVAEGTDVLRQTADAARDRYTVAIEANRQVFVL